MEKGTSAKEEIQKLGWTYKVQIVLKGEKCVRVKSIVKRENKGLRR